MHNIHSVYAIAVAPRPWTRPTDSADGVVPRITNVFHNMVADTGPEPPDASVHDAPSSEGENPFLNLVFAPNDVGFSEDTHWAYEAHLARVRRSSFDRNRPVLVHQDRAISVAASNISRVTTSDRSFDSSLDMTDDAIPGAYPGTTATLVSYQEDQEEQWHYPPEYGTPPPIETNQAAQPSSASSSAQVTYLLDTLPNRFDETILMITTDAEQGKVVWTSDAGQANDYYIGSDNGHIRSFDNGSEDDLCPICYASTAPEDCAECSTC